MNTDMNDGGAGATAENYFAAEGVSGNMLSFGQLEQATQGRNWLQGWNVSGVGRLTDGGIVDEVEERRASLEVAHQVWLYDEDEEARRAVDGHDRWSVYRSGITRRSDIMLPHYGRDYAELAMPGKKDDPWACVEQLIGAAPAERAKVYREAFEELKVSGRDRADDYWALCGRIVRDETRAKVAEHKAREREVQGSLKKLDRYIAGEAYGEGEDALSEGDVANAALVLDSKKMEDAKAVRGFMQTYVKPLEGLDDAGDILGAVRELEDEFFECIGEDEQRAAMAYIALMGFAERIKNSNMVDAGDEFVVTMGNTLQNWGHVVELVEPLVAAAPVGHPDFPIELPVETREGLYNEARRRAADYDRRNNARAILRRAINTALELSKTEGFWKGSLRAAAQMTGQTLPYLVPYVGQYLGTADVLVRGATETRDSYLLGQVADDGYYFNRLSGTAATNQAAIETGIQAAVELIPFGRVGGKGLSALLRGRVARGVAGGVTRWAVRVTQNSVGRALAAEIGANFVEEAVLEPIAAGIAQWGIEGAFDAMGIEHAPSKEFTECFAELSHIWNDPRQLVGMAMFSAALSGAGYKGIRANVEHFKDSRVMWEAQGLKPADVDIIMEAAPEERFDVGKRLVEEERARDPEGLKRRMIDANRAIKDRGEMLVWSGVGGSAEEQVAYAATWNEYVKQGLLPEVSAEDGGQYRIVDKAKGVDMVVPEAQADAYLAGALAQAETVLAAEARVTEERMRGVDLRAEMAEAVSKIAGNAVMRAVDAGSERSGIRVEDIIQGLPEYLAAPIKAKGQVTLRDAEAITEWALGQMNALMERGMSEREARMSKGEAQGMARSLGQWRDFKDDFVRRAEVAGMDAEDAAISVGRERREHVVRFNGREVFGQVLMGIGGRVSHWGAIEDITESVVDMMVQERAEVLLEGRAAERGRAATAQERADAEMEAMRELEAVVKRAREVVLKADKEAKIDAMEADERDVKKWKLGIVEALSDMARAKFLTSGVVPAWMRSLTEGLKGVRGVGAAIETLRAAYASALQANPEALAGLEEVLDKVGVKVRDVVAEARIEAVDIQAVLGAEAVVEGHAGGGAVGGAPVSRVVREAEEHQDEVTREERAVRAQPDEEPASVAEDAERSKEVLEGMVPGGNNAPEHMRGVFVNDACYYHEAGGYWCGVIDKHKLRDGTPQVKVGAKGKHGVIAGRELTGDFQHGTPAIYVWKRTNGELWVISGRHRFALLMEDSKAEYCDCYVYEEDAEHDEKWARILDYENNMRDDQADEVTAATYVRETGLSDEELKRRGFTRGGSKCKRGAKIGRYAKEELWTRFVNGAVKPMDAEIICDLTRGVRQQERVEEIQGKCCMLLATGKSWEYIGGMVQLMANKQQVAMSQGLLDFGADFQADLERAAEWVARSIRAIDETIRVLKDGLKQSGKKRDVAQRIGVNTEVEVDAEETLKDLQVLRKQYEMIGNYPELVQKAEFWDGESEVDPVGDYLDKARRERLEAEAEGEMSADEYLEAREKAEAEKLVPGLFGDGMSMEMRAVQSPEKLGEARLESYFEGVPGEDGVMDVPVGALMMMKDEPDSSVRNAWRFMQEAARGERARRAPVSVAENEDGTYTIVDGNATSLALAAHGASHVRVKVVGKNTGSRLYNSAYLVEEGTPGADADKRLRTRGLDGLHGDVAVQRAFEQAEENIPQLEKLVQAVADKTGGKVMMRPANDENGLATKKPSTAKDKANRDYRGDISRVVDLIGGTCVMRADGDFYDAVKAIRKMLATPEFKGCSVAKVKKLGFETMAPQYRDIKVSVRFANGGIGEIILVEETINDAKFNRGGHDIYDIMRELDPLIDGNEAATRAYSALEKLSALVYQTDSVVDAESFAHSKSKASSALEALRPLRKSFSSSLVAILVKSSDSLLKKAKPASVNSAATPSRSLIQNISNTILTDSVGFVNNNFSANEEKKVEENNEPGESPVTFSIRTKEEPKVKGIGYKVFYRGKDGKLYPPMVANPGGADTPVGVWLDADEGVRAGVSKTGRQQVKAGGKGTQGGSGTLAYRPGWHLGKIPYAIQFNRKNPVTGERDLFPADFVWAEVEYAADVDYQEEAMGYGVNKNGKFQHALAGLPRVPEDGYYEYRTNPNPKTEPWIITGAMKVVRVLTREQVDELVRAAGREPQMVEGDELQAAPVTFCVIGVSAKSWDKYAGRAFEGRDDGKLRAEIDASKAKLKLDGAGKVYRELLRDWEQLPEGERAVVEEYADLNGQYKRLRTVWRVEGDAAVEGEMRAKEAEAEAAKVAAFDVVEGWFKERGVDGVRGLLHDAYMESLVVSLAAGSEDSVVVDVLLRHSLRGHGSKWLRAVVAEAGEETREVFRRWLELDALVQEVYYGDDYDAVPEEMKKAVQAVFSEYLDGEEVVKERWEALLVASGVDRERLRGYESARFLELRGWYAESMASGEVNEGLAAEIDRLSVGSSEHRLDELLDYEELYEAYPQFRGRTVRIEKMDGGLHGWASGGEIAVSSALLGDEVEFRRTLLHEVQHWIQDIEGFARGGNKEGLYDRLMQQVNSWEWELGLDEERLAFFTAPEKGRDVLRAALGFLRNPKRAVKRSGLAMSLRRLSDTAEDTAERCLLELSAQYIRLVVQDNLNIQFRGIAEEDAWRHRMPEGVNFMDEVAVARALRRVEGLPGRRSMARGEAPALARKIKGLVRRKTQIEHIAKAYKWEPYELYRRLAGEIESRNVEDRMNFTAEERAEAPFNETLEFPSESIVTFCVIGVSAKSWDKYAERAFAGRDDGKLRAEIDASKAKLRWDVLPGGEVRAYRKMVNAHAREGAEEKPGEELVAVMWEYVRAAEAHEEQGEVFNKVDWSKREVFEPVYRATQASRDRLDAARVAMREALDGWFKRMGVARGVEALPERVLGDIARSVALNKEDEAVVAALGELPGRSFFPLVELLEFEELYEAYPELKWLEVRVCNLGMSVRGCLASDVWEDKPLYIGINQALLYRGEEAVRSTLLHEVQHWVQWREEFAKGGNMDDVGEELKAQLAAARDAVNVLRNEKYWLNAPAMALDVLKRLRRVQERPRAILKMGERFDVHEVEDVEVMAAEAVELLWLNYADMAAEDALGTRAYAPGAEYALPVAEGAEATPEKVEGLMSAIKALPKRKQLHRGREAKIDAELERAYAEVKKLGDMEGLPEVEQYKRVAGEIESRNVQGRMNMTAEERAEVPFNDTLEFPGEALVTFSMEEASLKALNVLRTRADEREGERLVNDWQKQCELLGMMHDDKEPGVRLGKGAKMLGEIHALISATKGVLPEKYTHMGRLNGLLKWAAVYARMQQEGEVPVDGVIAGDIYAKFVRKMQEVDAMNRLHGLTPEEAKEALALLAGERLDVAMLKVATECKRRLELFLKDRERERIDWVVEKAYPKREKGKRTPRGKMDADAYRRMERAYALMEMEPNEVAGLINRLKGALDKLETEPADAVEVLRGMRHRVTVPDVLDVDGLEEALEDELFLAHTFGAWENMSFEQARAACGAMADMVLLGRSAWQSALDAERRRAAYDREEIARHFKVPVEQMQAERGVKGAQEKGRKRTIAKKIAMGSMSYSQLMLALESKLGKRFTGRHMRMIAAAHEELMMENRRRQRWMYDTLARITGLKTEGEIEEWLASNNEVFDTGIDLVMPMKTKAKLTRAEAEMWVRMTREEREAKRVELVEAARAKGEKPTNVPSEAMIHQLEEMLVEDAEGAADRLYTVEEEWSYTSRLKTTKEALMFAILTFEQEDYEHLLEVNGLDAEKLHRMRKLVGGKLLSWGYAMRKELGEHGKLMAKAYEAYTGVPFGSRQNYFRGVFDVARAKDTGEVVDQVGGVTGGKYGSLIARQYHNQQLNWSTSATAVFIASMKEQANYIATAHISREWRTLLSDRLFERRLRAEIGDAALDMVHGWCSMIDGAVLADAKVNALLNRFFGRILSAYAVSRLAGNVYTVMKQVSALLNGFVGGYVPERVMAGNELVRDLTYRHIGFGEYLKALSKAVAGKTEIKLEEIEEAGFIQGRVREAGSNLEAAALLAPGQKVPGKVARVARGLYEANMDAIGYVDRKANTRSALAIAEAVYQQAKKENKDGLVPDAELRRVAIETARMMVDRASQPQLRTQKGYWAAGGGAFGALGNFFYMFKSETLGKLGLYVSQMMSGQHGAWIKGALCFGVMNSVVLALIDAICGRWYDDDEDKWWKRAKGFAGNVLFNDISTVPLVGEAPAWLRAEVFGERRWNNSVVDMVVPFIDMWKYGKQEVKHAGKGASWDKHVAALCGLARSVGAFGGWGQNSSVGAVASCAELALAGAAISNVVRFVKDVAKRVEEALD